MTVTPGRGRFTYTDVPPTVYYGGRTLPLQKRQALILQKLIVAPMVTADDLLTVGIKNRRSLHTHLSLIRAHLPAGVRLVNRHKVGYMLEIRQGG